MRFLDLFLQLPGALQAALVTSILSLFASIGMAFLSLSLQKRLEAAKADQQRQVEQRKAEFQEQLETVRAKFQGNLEHLRSSLASAAAADTARRAYEYDSRKRLYTECEPIFFQLVEAADLALRACRNLSDPKMWRELRVEKKNWDSQEPWMLNKSSELIGVLYALYAPLALYVLLRGKLTTIDCTVDHGVWFRFLLSRELYVAFQSDASLAACLPTLEYNPLVPGWRQKRLERPAIHWWQGLSPGRLDRAVRLFIVQEGQTQRLATFGEFEDMYVAAYEGSERSQQKLLGIAANPIYGFNPSDRPVFARLIMVQVHLHVALRQAVPKDPTSLLTDRGKLKEYLRLKNCRAAWPINMTTGDPQEVALEYLSHRLCLSSRLISYSDVSAAITR
jgi:hypothetical protein